MSKVVEGSEKRIGLALSGGGFRAAAFHFGVFRALESLGLLDKVDVMSCVSGGSIAGAVVALSGFTNRGLKQLEQYVRTKSVAVASVVGGLVDPFHTRLEKLAESYERDLFGNQTLDALRSGPRVYFNATNVATGNAFFFVAGGNKDSEAGEHELGFVDASSFPLSRAVAASSAFPPVFPPLVLSTTFYPAAKGVEYSCLTDGGVYDNMGVNPMFVDANNVHYMIVSDGGAPFSFDERPTESSAMVLRASIDIMMEQIRGLEFERMKYRHLAGKGPMPLWFSIDSEVGQAQPGDAAMASRIQTNLRALTDTEFTTLARHGAALAEKRLRTFAAELLV